MAKMSFTIRPRTMGSQQDVRPEMNGRDFLTPPNLAQSPSGGTPRRTPVVKSLPQSGYMPLPSRTRSAVAGASFLSLGSPRLTKWTIQDAGYELNAKIVGMCQKEFTKHTTIRSTSKMDVNNHLSHAYMKVEGMLSGQVALEDFVQAVENAEGVQRWALWMEISGRLQVAQSASKSVLREEKNRDFIDEPGWSQRNDRILAQSIMRKPLLESIGVQVDECDLDECNNPFYQLDGKDTHDGKDTVPKPPQNIKSASGKQDTQPKTTVKSARGMSQEVHRHARHNHMHSHGSGHWLHDDDSEDHNAMQLLRCKVAVLDLSHKVVGLDQKQLCHMISKHMPGATQTDICRIFIVDEPSKELEPFQFEQSEGRISLIQTLEKSIAGETFFRKQYLHVQDVSTSNFFNPSIDLGTKASTQSKWKNCNLVSFPVFSNLGMLEMIIILGRISSPFSNSEIEAFSWMAVNLGTVLNHNNNLVIRESQINLMDNVAENSILLAHKGCEVQDPRFWMRAFDAQVAQIALVHRDPPTKRSLLYCNCSDTSKEEVSMTCFPLRGMHKKIILQANGLPWWSNHAEEERSLIDREIDLGSSEWIGRTSMMLIPIMSGSEGTVATTSEGTVEGEKQDRVVGIIMIASTVRVYASAHRKMLMAMTSHIRPALVKVLESWDRDETGAYKDSFIMSEGCQRLAVEDDHVSEVYKDPDPASLLQNAKEAQEAAHAALRREALVQASAPKLYEYPKEGVIRMLDEEAAGKVASARNQLGLKVNAMQGAASLSPSRLNSARRQHTRG